MKYVVILGDGMSDHSEPEKGWKTPLMAANIPSIDSLAADGRCGLLRTVPDSLPPGSEVANMSILGYDVESVFEGRGVLEAASMGVSIESGDVVLRCNLICVEGGNIKNHSAGHITSKEAEELISYLNESLGSDRVKFYPGVSYRHLLVIKAGSKSILCTPPHDVPGAPYRDVLPSAICSEGRSTAGLLRELIEKSYGLLEVHPVNVARGNELKDKANLIWPWSPGIKPKMRPFGDMFGLGKGAVISAVDLIQGMGICASLNVIKVDGATGLYDTNYEGKAMAAVDALRSYDFVYLHVEASDEAGHEGDFELKVKTIEYLDSRIVKYVMEETAKFEEPVAIAVLPDHSTPWKLKTHTRDAVPFVIYRPGEPSDGVEEYNEKAVEKGGYGVLEGNMFMKALLGIDKYSAALDI